MSGNTKIPCRCTMQRIAVNKWVKPAYGYSDPDPDCHDCGGKGYQMITINFGKSAETMYVGICPICSSKNGMYFHYVGQPLPWDTDSSAPNCKNAECLGELCTWVHVEDWNEI